jgi:glucose/mannose-6-phosphate isomerase
MMEDAIRNFAKQFAYQPVIENQDALARKPWFLVVGMGGSHLGGDMLLRLKPTLPLRVHMDYGLPVLPPGELEESLVICSSYSGNTEEVLEAYENAREQGLDLAVIAVGGTLIEWAKRDGVAYIQMPDTHIQPRSALGFSVLAHLKLIGEDALLSDISGLAGTLKPEEVESAGKVLAEKIKGYVPVVYSSHTNWTLAWNWKIKFNETGKIPAFHNIFSELNHNEMTGFDVQESSRQLSDGFYFIILKDSDDHPKIQKRMDVLKKLYEGRGLQVEMIKLEGKTLGEKMFSSLVLADWTAVHSAALYGLESEQVPMVEEFKKMIA